MMDARLLMNLLTARNGGALPEGAEDPQAALARMAHDNPAVATLLQMMEAQKLSAAAREPVVIEGAAEPPAEAQLADLTAQLQESQAELRLLRERCDTVAAALGACGLCWGEDHSCRACRGQGAPGRAIPDEQLFCEIVVPAVRLVHANRQRSAQRSAESRLHVQSSKQPEGSTSWN
jgi:hypothetical protein